MQSTASNLEFKLNINLRLVKPDFMQSTAVNLEFKLKVIFKLLSCNRPLKLHCSEPKCTYTEHYAVVKRAILLSRLYICSIYSDQRVLTKVEATITVVRCKRVWSDWAEPNLPEIKFHQLGLQTRVCVIIN